MEAVKLKYGGNFSAAFGFLAVNNDFGGGGKTKSIDLKRCHPGKGFQSLQGGN